MNPITSKNPYTGELINEYKPFEKKEIENAISKTFEIQKKWAKVPVNNRAEKFLTLSKLLRLKKEDLAKIITLEMGKVYREAIAEVEKCAWVCEYYSQNAESFLLPEQIKTDYQKSFVTYNPLGVILAIMPWNFPFWQIFRAAVPVIIAGNTMILKHASNVTGCAFAIEKLFEESGFEPNTITTILVKGIEMPEIICDSRIAGVTLTGSTQAGISVATSAAASLKKTVLELGGSDPYIILEDANIELAVDKCVKGRLLNAGQSCIGAKRFIVVNKIYEKFVELFKNQMASAKTGDPFAPDTTYGPLANKSFKDELHNQVLKSIQLGAVNILGGNDNFKDLPLYLPTVLTNVSPKMPAYDDELFGPVASVIKAKDERDAIRIANDTNFGLGAAIFTQDIEKGLYIAQNEIEAGCCFVNDFVKSDPRLHFGGIKQSGYGRELSLWGIREFTNVKTVVSG